MHFHTPTCVGCGTVGSEGNPLLTVLPQEPTLTFYACLLCWGERRPWGDDDASCF